VNLQLFELLNHLAGRYRGVDDVMEFLAQWLIYVVFAVAAILAGRALRRRELAALLRVAVALLIAYGTAVGLSAISHELRPFQTHAVTVLIPHAGGVSMPSDHAVAAFTVAFAVTAFLHRRWGLVLAVAALAIGVARVWVGVHYPDDVLAGAMIAALSVLEVGVWTRWRPPSPASISARSQPRAPTVRRGIAHGER
jgi:undecaprenyl-diphosphatase